MIPAQFLYGQIKNKYHEKRISHYNEIMKVYLQIVLKKPLRYLEGFFMATIKVVYVRKFSYIHFVNKGANNPII